VFLTFNCGKCDASTIVGVSLKERERESKHLALFTEDLSSHHAVCVGVVKWICRGNCEAFGKEVPVLHTVLFKLDQNFHDFLSPAAPSLI